MKIIFIFIDGFGMGEYDPKKNPIVSANTPGLDNIYNNFTVIPTDATLGIEGLPQSATGQTAIFTGINGSKLLGHHMSGQPTKTLVEIINKTNIFKELINRGFTVTYANVYRDSYLKTLGNIPDRRNRPSVTTVMGMSVGMKFRNTMDYLAENGVYHDITGQILIDSGLDTSLITPGAAAKRLYKISRDYDFTLYEHFMTDIIGHKGDLDLSINRIELLDSFIGEIVNIIDLEKDLIIITSDHGNIEDITVKTHTMNKVPTIFIGKLPEGVELKINSLLDILPAVVEILNADREKKENTDERQ